MHHNLFKHHPLKDLQRYFQFWAIMNKEILLDMKNFKYTHNSYLSTQRQGASSQNNSNNNNQLALVFLKIIFINKG